MSGLDAEVRAVEEGHRAFRIVGHTYRVVSDTVEGRGWIVSAAATREGRLVLAVCESEDSGDDGWPLDGRGHGRLEMDDGHVRCKHMAVVMRRLEREGVVEWDDCWIAKEAFGG